LSETKSSPPIPDFATAQSGLLPDELNPKRRLDLNMRRGEASGDAAALSIPCATPACHTSIVTVAEVGISD